MLVSNNSELIRAAAGRSGSLALAAGQDACAGVEQLWSLTRAAAGRSGSLALAAGRDVDAGVDEL